jgi:hypothetical protein
MTSFEIEECGAGNPHPRHSFDTEPALLLLLLNPGSGMADRPYSGADIQLGSSITSHPAEQRPIPPAKRNTNRIIALGSIFALVLLAFYSRSTTTSIASRSHSALTFWLHSLQASEKMQGKRNVGYFVSSPRLSLQFRFG